MFRHRIRQSLYEQRATFVSVVVVQLKQDRHGLRRQFFDFHKWFDEVSFEEVSFQREYTSIKNPSCTKVVHILQ